MIKQTTLKKSGGCFGIGLHTGEQTSIILEPAPLNTGLVFIRDDVYIPARSIYVVDACCAVKLQYPGNDTTVSTVEHILAALRGLGIDNAYIKVNGPEIPAMDGSASKFVELIRSLGIEYQDASRRVFKITKEFEYEGIRIEPNSMLVVDAIIQYPFDKALQQRFSTIVLPQTFEAHIAFARTYGYVDSLEYLHKAGKAKGASLENVLAVASERNRILNKEGLRSQDEFVRHKVLDIVGDFALAGLPIYGRIIAYKTGHVQHVKFIQKFFLEHRECWRCEDA